jgi:hypothetical protein
MHSWTYPTLTHGGTYYKDPLNPFVPTYDLNCKPNFPSVMSYLFQIRGFPDGGIGYSGQKLPNLSETALNESAGIGLDSSNQLAWHYTRWYAPPSGLDLQLQNAQGESPRYASSHCDGTAIGQNEPRLVRVDGTTFSAPIDWNNNLTVPDAVEPVAWQDEFQWHDPCFAGRSVRGIQRLAECGPSADWSTRRRIRVFRIRRLASWRRFTSWRRCR